MADKIKQPPKLNGGARTVTEIPDLVKAHDKVRADIKARKDDTFQPPVKNPLNRADSKVEAVRESSTHWKSDSPFKLEEFQHQSTDYRGQGLLPTDRMDAGYRVKDASKLKMPQYPAGKKEGK